MHLLQNVYRPRQRLSRWISIGEIGATVSHPVEPIMGLESDIRVQDGRVQRRLNSLLRKSHYNQAVFLDMATEYVLDGQDNVKDKDPDAVGLLFLLSVLVDLHSWGC